MKKTLYVNPKMEMLVKNVMLRAKLSSEKVYSSMIQVDRGDFCDYSPYTDSPKGIGYNATISAPHMHALALDYLKDYLLPDNTVLDVGCGSGYLCAAFSKMMNDKGLVIGIEHIPELVELSTSNLRKSFSYLLDNSAVKIVEGDGRKGYPDSSPFNCIHVGAASPKVPQLLIDQLKNGGRMMIPIGEVNDFQSIYIIDKDKTGKVTEKSVFGVRYVPLTSKENQIGK